MNDRASHTVYLRVLWDQVPGLCTSMSVWNTDSGHRASYARLIPYPLLPTKLTGPYSCRNSHFQDSQLFTVASLGLLPVILSGIKCCDGQQGDSVSSMVKCSKMACVGDNSITQTTHNICDKKLTGNRAKLADYTLHSRCRGQEFSLQPWVTAIIYNSGDWLDWNLGE